MEFTAYPEEFIRAYVTAAQEYQPIIPDSLHTYIAESYVEKRKLQVESEAGAMYITPRTLLGVIRTA
jgi:DNA replicative helicase MCM subunit Mcm2 (Cdc46/Mcm family)